MSTAQFVVEPTKSGLAWFKNAQLLCRIPCVPTDKCGQTAPLFSKSEEPLYAPLRQWTKSTKTHSTDQNYLSEYRSNTRTGKVIFFQFEVAQNAYDAVGKQPLSLQRLKDVATEWSRMVAPGMDSLLKNDAEARTRIGLAGFGSLDENHRPKLILVKIPITVPNDGSSASTGTPTIYEWLQKPEQSLGTGGYAANLAAIEFLDAKTERAKKAKAAFEYRATRLPQRDRYANELIAAVEAALEWRKEDPTIGPPVDAVVIETGSGIRWIRRKPKSNCSNVAPNDAAR